MLFRRLAVLAAVAGLGSPADAATLLGETVRVTHEYPSQGFIFSGGGPFDVVVGAGVEVPNVISFYSVDLSDGNAFLNFTQIGAGGTFTAAAFNGVHLFDLNGTIPTFLSVTINPATNVAGFDASHISFDANNIYANFQNLFVNSSSRVSLDITAVPEPGTLESIGLALACLALLRRCNRR